MTSFNLPSLPTPAEKRMAVHLTQPAAKAIKAGHPWLFDQGIEKLSHPGRAGDLAVLFDHYRRFVGIGLYDPHSPIRVKVLHHGQPAEINQAWFETKIAQAINLRRPLLDSPRTNGYRLIHGENDGLPGLVLDRYAQTGVLKLYSPIWLPYLSILLPAVLQNLPLEQLVLRLSRTTQHEQLFGLADGQVLFGPPVTAEIVFQENGLVFLADVLQGHKTGFFLDQRENRARVGELAAGQDVLDVFAYNGGFSLYSARGGARSITSLDISQPALRTITTHFKLNDHLPAVAATPHHLLAGDAFELLAQLAQQKKLYDLVVIDPPSFAKSQAEIERAFFSYGRLAELGLGVLQPGGLLVMSSCSSRVTADQFFNLVQRTAAAVERPLREVQHTLHPLDHPVTFPEGAYLKCLFGRA